MSLKHLFCSQGIFEPHTAIKLAMRRCVGINCKLTVSPERADRPDAFEVRADGKRRNLPWI